MSNVFRIAALCLAVLTPSVAAAADAATFVTNKELKWVDLPEPKGAKQAILWGDAKSSENAVLTLWPFNAKVADQVRTQELHIVVLAGTFTSDVGGVYKEYGPSGVIVIPKGVKHTLGCEAAGECRFLVHHPGAVEVTKAK